MARVRYSTQKVVKSVILVLIFLAASKYILNSDDRFSTELAVEDELNDKPNAGLQTTHSQHNEEKHQPSELEAAREKVNNYNKVEQSDIVEYVNKNVEEKRVNTADMKPILDKGSQKMNVLFLMADDLRPEIEPYYGSHYPNLFSKKMVTPNFQRLAKKSIVFERAYVQVSLCGPSRTSMLTSRRPDITRVFNNKYYWRIHAGNFTTLPQYFKENGYQSIGIGKIFHKSSEPDNKRDLLSWSEPFYFTYFDPSYETPGYVHNWYSVNKEEREKNPLSDDSSITYAINRLKELSQNNGTTSLPFFMALGFQRPHTSLICPKEYFDLYPLETGEQYLPVKEWQTTKAFDMINTTEINDTRYFTDIGLRLARRAYFACVSYVDSLIGDLLDALQEYSFAENTIVSYISDHGFQIGENNHWGKTLANELSNRVPFIIHIPGKTDQGIRTGQIVEAIDIFPTIISAAGLTKPPKCPRSSSDIELCADGTNLLPLITNPDQRLKDFALSQVQPSRKWMRYSVRTDRYRYTQNVRIHYHKEKDGRHIVIHDLEEVRSRYPESEFYDHKTDPDGTYNLIEDPDYAENIRVMKKRLKNYLTNIHGVLNKK